MQDGKKESRQAALNFLKKHPMGVLSTVDQAGQPWGSAIYYVADEDFNFYFVTRVETLKYQNLDATKVAALTIADKESQSTVQATGQVSKVPLEDYVDVVFNRLAKAKLNDHSWAPPISKVNAGNYMALRLKPTRLQYTDYKAAKVSPKDVNIQQIIP